VGESLGGKMVGRHLNGSVDVECGMVVEMRRNKAESYVDRDADHEADASFDSDDDHAFAVGDILAYLSPALRRCFAEMACGLPPASHPLPLRSPSLSTSRNQIQWIRGSDRGRTRLLGRKKRSRPIL
jgi:hypothetical protein